MLYQLSYLPELWAEEITSNGHSMRAGGASQESRRSGRWNCDAGAAALENESVNLEKLRDAVVVEDAFKQFEGAATAAVDGASMRAGGGKFIALAGPPASGKTTFLRMLAGRLRPTSGKISILGRDPIKEARGLLTKMAWVPAFSAFPPGLALRDVAKLCRELGGGGDAFLFAQICTALSIDPNSNASRFSKFDNYVASVALALQKSPNIIIADEPADAPEDSLSKILANLSTLKKNNTTFIVGHRRMEQILPFADELHLFRNGKIVDTIVPAPGERQNLQISEFAQKIEQVAPALPAEPAATVTSQQTSPNLTIL